MDPLTHTLYYVTEDGDLGSNSGIQIPLDSDAISGGEILSLAYLQDRDQCCLIFSSGEILLVGEGSQESKSRLEFDGGFLLAAAWAPSQEILSLLTSAGSLILLNAHFELLAKTPILDAIADPGNIKTAAFAWKSDSKFLQIVFQTLPGWLAVSYTSEGQIFISAAKSDPPGGLVQCIGERTGLIDNQLVSWQHEGLITGVKELTVVFWEKNGLLRSRFLLKGSGTVSHLEWNSEGDVLMVAVQKEAETHLQLWIRSNNHWYLKQELPFTDVQAIHWADAYHLMVLTSVLTSLELKLDYTVSEIGLAVVIDGPKALLTRLDKESIPPPMSSYEISLPGVPQACCFSSDFKPCFLIENRLFLLEDELVLKGRIDGQIILGTILTAKKSIFAFTKGPDLYELDENSVSKVVFSAEKDIIAISSVDRGIYIEDKSGALTLLENGRFSSSGKLVKPCIYFTAVELNGQTSFLGLHRSSKCLYYGQNLLSSLCISFRVSGTYLFYTVLANAPLHLLYIFALDRPFPVHFMGPDHPATVSATAEEAYFMRNVERGTRIIASTGIKLVLQMPRGNLETIYPRLLVINRVKELIEKSQFLPAFETLKTHKLDLNFLCDVDFPGFIGKIHEFVRQLGTADRLNLFITNLSNIDSAKKYLFNEVKTVENKVNLLCEGLKTALEAENEGNRLLLSIMTTYIKKEPPQMIEALRIIQELKNRMPAKPQKPPHLTQTRGDRTIYAEDALKYVCWLADADKLYDLALSTYDLELVLMVAQHTQKDPKEYLPQLQRLSDLPEVERKVEINMVLGKFQRALEELKNGGEAYYAKAVQLVREKALYGPALTLFKDTAIEHDLESMFGLFLSKQELHFQAGIMYRKAGEASKALISFQVWTIDRELRSGI